MKQKKSQTKFNQPNLWNKFWKVAKYAYKMRQVTYPNRNLSLLESVIDIIESHRTLDLERNRIYGKIKLDDDYTIAAELNQD